MNASLKRLLAIAAIAAIGTALASLSHADPLAGQVPKFDQQPMIATPITNTTGTTNTYYGHDELSTAYGTFQNGAPPQLYQGKFMADDFADNFNTPVVHVTWWGSYIDNNNAANPPQAAVKKFLIAFESDVPAGPAPGFSTPGQVLQYDIVDNNSPLAPGSGTFTETLVRPADPVLGEALYKYNAELHLGHEFFEQPDTVYWLKIAALVDLPQGSPIPPTPGSGVTQWGWHNRDYATQDLLAAPVSPNVSQGEFVEGVVDGQNVYHFQDDAVQGDLRFVPNPPVGSPAITQNNMVPQDYVYSITNSTGTHNGIDGPVAIAGLSKDLAFTLFTPGPNVPEPATCALMAIGLAGVLATRRRSRRV